MDCLTGEYDNDSENDLEQMIGQIKTYDSFVAEIEAIRLIKPVRDNTAHRLVLTRRNRPKDQVVPSLTHFPSLTSFSNGCQNRKVCQTRKSMSDSENSMSDSEKCVRLGKTLQKSEITLRDELS